MQTNTASSKLRRLLTAANAPPPCRDRGAPAHTHAGHTVLQARLPSRIHAGCTPHTQPTENNTQGRGAVSHSGASLPGAEPAPERGGRAGGEGAAGRPVERAGEEGGSRGRMLGTADVKCSSRLALNNSIDQQQRQSRAELSSAAQSYEKGGKLVDRRHNMVGGWSYRTPGQPEERWAEVGGGQEQSRNKARGALNKAKQAGGRAGGQAGLRGGDETFLFWPRRSSTAQCGGGPGLFPWRCQSGEGMDAGTRRRKTGRERGDRRVARGA